MDIVVIDTGAMVESKEDSVDVEVESLDVVISAVVSVNVLVVSTGNVSVVITALDSDASVLEGIDVVGSTVLVSDSVIEIVEKILKVSVKLTGQ